MAQVINWCCIIGLSEMQVEKIGGDELREIKSEFERLAKKYNKKVNPQITYTIVQKRISNRFFLKQNSQFFSPFPGTYISSRCGVTSEMLTEFYLVPSAAHPNQGTATPTRFTVLQNNAFESLFSEQAAEKKLASFSFQLCFMYFNWPGSIRIPAPLQYAAKLSKLCTEFATGLVHRNLQGKNWLYFL